jgi:hypothetical protein
MPFATFGRLPSHDCSNHASTKCLGRACDIIKRNHRLSNNEGYAGSEQYIEQAARALQVLNL